MIFSYKRVHNWSFGHKVKMKYRRLTDLVKLLSPKRNTCHRTDVVN